MHKHFLSKRINIYTCDRTAYGTLKVKNCLVNPVYCITDCTICSIEIFARLACYTA
jgi:hypothetical protein